MFHVEHLGVGDVPRGTLRWEKQVPCEDDRKKARAMVKIAGFGRCPPSQTQRMGGRPLSCSRCSTWNIRGRSRSERMTKKREQRRPKRCGLWPMAHLCKREGWTVTRDRARDVPRGTLRSGNVPRGTFMAGIRWRKDRGKYGRRRGGPIFLGDGGRVEGGLLDRSRPGWRSSLGRMRGA